MSEPNLKARLLFLIVRDFPNKKKGIRADVFLAAQDALPSRSQLKRWFSDGLVTRRGIALGPADILHLGDEISIAIPDLRPAKLEARELPLKIYFEDESLIVLYKPRGISMHPGATKDDRTTLVHALLHHSNSLSDKSGEFRPGIVHRLDKDTEGLVVVAKNNEVHEDLSQQFSKRSIKRAYWALCAGKTLPKFEVEASIGRDPRNRKRMAVVRSGGREARTSFETLESYLEGYSWIKCKLHTGRTHQIRVHLSHKGHPILNDPVYGKAQKRISLSDEKTKCLEGLEGQCLMAYELGFVHPVSGKEIHFELNPKKEMPSWLKILTNN
mgnify:CR=1 FL=1